MFTKSLWNHFTDFHDHPALDRDITVDVAVIGGGITGLSTALLLAQKGLRSAVIEARKVGGGTTSHSTGNLYCTIDKVLSSLSSKYDLKTIEAVSSSRLQAMHQISTWVNKFGLDCDYKTAPWYLYSHNKQNVDKIDQEYDTARKAGVGILRAEETRFPYPASAAVEVPDQAQFNPMRYTQELARAARSDRCLIFENTAVSSVEKRDGHYELMTPHHRVRAEKVVHATHSPKGIHFVHTLLGPYREYGIACPTQENDHPEGIFWGYYGSGQKISTRTYSRAGRHFLIVIGEAHKVGQAGNNVRSIQNLEAFAQKHFNIHDVSFRWGGQHYRPADLLPYIGPVVKGSGEYIATGYSTDGLIYGTLAGMILSDEITGRKNPLSELYDATRKRPLKSASEFLKENVNVAKEYLKDMPGSAKKSGFEDLQPGEAGVFEKDGEKLAAHRTEEGELQVHSAVCTHMECIVNWNNAEQSWDCPCHGSRFDVDGSVLEGPAFHPLNKVRFTGKSVTVEGKH